MFNRKIDGISGALMRRARAFRIEASSARLFESVLRLFVYRPYQKVVCRNKLYIFMVFLAMAFVHNIFFFLLFFALSLTLWRSLCLSWSSILFEPTANGSIGISVLSFVLTHFGVMVTLRNRGVYFYTSFHLNFYTYLFISSKERTYLTFFMFFFMPLISSFSYSFAVWLFFSLRRVCVWVCRKIKYAVYLNADNEQIVAQHIAWIIFPMHDAFFYFVVVIIRIKKRKRNAHSTTWLLIPVNN